MSMAHGLGYFFRALNIQRDMMTDSVRMELELNTYLGLGRLLSSFSHMDTGAIRDVPESCFAWRPGRWPGVTTGVLMDCILYSHQYFNLLQLCSNYLLCP